MIVQQCAYRVTKPAGIFKTITDTDDDSIPEIFWGKKEGGVLSILGGNGPVEEW